MPADPLGASLLILARNAIGRHFAAAPHPVAPLPEFSALAATFVTLTQSGQLRGCIGSLEAHRPLAEDVAENAVAAAFRDPRFVPLPADEFLQTRIEVSLLETPRAMTCSDEADLLRQLRPDLDGLILRFGNHRATFLPQVWESLPEPRRFLHQLKLKAGLPADFWDQKIAFSRYGVQKWKEN